MDAPLPGLLEFENLTAERRLPGGEREVALRGVSLQLPLREILLLAGESGCGKSLLCHLAAAALPPGVKILSGSVRFEGRELLRAGRRKGARLRRGAVTLVSAAPRRQFPEGLPVRAWIRETLALAGTASEFGDESDWIDLFHRAGILEPESVLPVAADRLPSLTVLRLHVLRALLAKSRLLVFEEPAAPLDRVAESRFFELLREVRASAGISVLVSSGELRGAERYADRAAVLYEGGVLECAPVSELLSKPRFAYTREFLACTPGLDRRDALTTISREAAREAEGFVGRHLALSEGGEAGEGGGGSSSAGYTG